MLLRYVRADLVRNPRRTLSTMVGVTLGVGLSCAVLFFVDGLSASMTQRAVAPLSIDMQRVLTDTVGGDLDLDEVVAPDGPLAAGDVVEVRLALRNDGAVPANEVIIRSKPAADLDYVAGSAMIDGSVVDDGTDSPFARGPAQAGLNIGTVEPDATVELSYRLAATAPVDSAAGSVRSTFSSREAVNPVEANAPAHVALADLAAEVEAVAGVASAEPLSFVDLAPGALSSRSGSAIGPPRVFGFSSAYADRDEDIRLIEGEHRPGEALVSAETAAALGVGVGDPITIQLPDGAQAEVTVSGVADITQARALFSSRQGSDFETFSYNPTSVVLDPETFQSAIVPSFERAAAATNDRLKNPPVREVDITVETDRLDADPAAALVQTEAIAAAVSDVAGRQDFLIDNISNTLAVARADASVAKRMFVFLGIPGGLLAAILAGYAGSVLAGAQRREQATLRIRGASRRHLLGMLAIRVGVITVVGAALGVLLGYLSAVAVIGQDTLARATTTRLVTSALLGTVGGLLATGTALYVTGRRSIDREINEDRARLVESVPLWRRFRLDVLALVGVVVVTWVAIARSAFEGTAGSVYVGRSVELPLGLLVLPIGAWMAGALLAGRLFGGLMGQRDHAGSVAVERPLPTLYRLSLRRRAWSVADGAVIVALIVALGTSLAGFTASYDGAKAADARYATGGDLRVTPSPASGVEYTSADTATFQVDGVEQVTPVVYGTSNAIVRSNRTSEVTNLAAVDPSTFPLVAPLEDGDFVDGSAAAALDRLVADPAAIMLSADMAAFLQAEVGAPLKVLLARGRDVQAETDVVLVGLFERLPGFPDGAEALMTLEQHEATVPTVGPDVFLATTSDRSAGGLEASVAALRDGPGTDGGLQIESRATSLAKDQSSLAALNIRGLLDLDGGYALAMGTVTIAIFVFGLLLQRRREYVTLKAQGLSARSVRGLIGAEAATVAVAGCIAGVVVGVAMAAYLVNVLRPLFVLAPPFRIPLGATAQVIASVLVATAITSIAASSLVNRLQATELLRDE